MESKYSIELLVAKKEPHKFLFFWGHQPSPKGTIGKSCFSQWWTTPFEISSIKYKTAEHFMMAEKARLFNNLEIAEQIISCSSPAEAKKLGREVKGFEQEVWEAHRFSIVKTGNYHKFNQNQKLKEFLLNTKTRVLVEASPVDPIWGIGMAEDNPKVFNPENWRGLNLLGFALMEVRDELTKENESKTI
ncbi:MAG: NADAR family protein [Crocinitomicaceae bacterium]|nr:NADAR family protein [Crocinitomicaceae bacterium]